MSKACAEGQSTLCESSSLKTTPMLHYTEEVAWVGNYWCSCVQRKIRTRLDLLSIPQSGGGNVKTFGWDQGCKYKSSSWHLNGCPDGSTCTPYTIRLSKNYCCKLCESSSFEATPVSLFCFTSATSSSKKQYGTRNSPRKHRAALLVWSDRSSFCSSCHQPGVQ